MSIRGQRSRSHRSNRTLSPVWKFLDCNSSWKFRDGYWNDAPSLSSCTVKKPNITCLLTYWNDAQSLLWHSRKRLLIVFWGHLSNFKVTWAEKLTILTQIECFWTVIPVWIHRWFWNNAQNLNWHRRSVLWFFKVICLISMSHGQKIANFDPNCFRTVTLVDSPMALKCCTKLEVAQKTCPIVFQGHLWNFKVTQGEELTIWHWLEHFWMVTWSWIHDTHNF